MNIEDVFLDECPASPMSHIAAVGGEPAHSSGLTDVSIYLTHACNLRCSHCYLAAGDPLRGELSVENWLTVLDKIGGMGAKFVYLLGGEPMLLMEKGLITIIRHARDVGLRVAMSTNGTLLDEQAAERLKHAGIDQVQVSVDGPSPEINDAIRGPGSFNAAIRAAKSLRDAGVPFSLSCVVTHSNASLVSDMIELANNLGAAAITFIRIQNFGRGKVTGTSLSNEEARQALQRMLEAKAKVKVIPNGFRFHLGNLREAYSRAKAKATGYLTCPAGRSRFVIDSNGDVYGCELLMEWEFLEGNAVRDDLRRIWENGFKAFRERRTRIACTCDMADLCGLGCPARAFAAGGSMNVPDPLCPIAPSLRGSITP